MSQPEAWPPSRNEWEHLVALAEADAALQPHAKFDALDTWRGLVTGRIKVAATFNTQERTYLAIFRTTTAQPPPAAPIARDVTILAGVLLGNAQKVGASDSEMSVSSIADISRRCLRFMGVRCRPSRAPLALVLLTHAAHVPGSAIRVDVRNVDCRGRVFQLLSMERPDRNLEARLTKAQAAVVRLLVEGRSHYEMAAVRGRSARTIANQLASAFSTLKVSGRGELVRSLLATELG